MKLYIKILLYSIAIIPIAAYLDAMLIRGMSFTDYLYVCTWEMLIFNIGVLVGIRILKKELNITSS